MAALGTTCEPWPLVPCCPGWDADAAKWTPAQKQAVRLASLMMWRATAGRYGLCPVTVRPCSGDCDDSQPILQTLVTGVPWVPLLINGEWRNCGTCSGGCAGPCGGCCPPICQLTLPGPVYDILQIKVDGAIVAPINYVVHDHKTLVGQGDFCWPDCQDYSKPDTQPGTWSVTYRRGVAPPEDGLIAAGFLACELALLCERKPCRLPANAVSVDREGVSYQLDPDWADRGLTGVPQADAWIRLVNPNGRRSKPLVWSPAQQHVRHVSWPAAPVPPGGV